MEDGCEKEILQRRSKKHSVMRGTYFYGLKPLIFWRRKYKKRTPFPLPRLSLEELIKKLQEQLKVTEHNSAKELFTSDVEILTLKQGLESTLGVLNKDRTKKEEVQV